jgi:hypothetical protein
VAAVVIKLPGATVSSHLSPSASVRRGAEGPSQHHKHKYNHFVTKMIYICGHRHNNQIYMSLLFMCVLSCIYLSLSAILPEIAATWSSPPPPPDYFFPSDFGSIPPAEPRPPRRRDGHGSEAQSPGMQGLSGPDTARPGPRRWRCPPPACWPWRCPPWRRPPAPPRCPRPPRCSTPTPGRGPRWAGGTASRCPGVQDSLLLLLRPGVCRSQGRHILAAGACNVPCSHG